MSVMLQEAACGSAAIQFRPYVRAVVTAIGLITLQHVALPYALKNDTSCGLALSPGALQMNLLHAFQRNLHSNTETRANKSES
jgi:hypothetical protein